MYNEYETFYKQKSFCGYDKCINPECDNNWKLTGCKIDSEKQAAMVALIKEGKLTLPTSEDGRTPNVKALTWADVEAAQKDAKKAA